MRRGFVMATSARIGEVRLMGCALREVREEDVAVLFEQSGGFRLPCTWLPSRHLITWTGTHSRAAGLG